MKTLIRTLIAYFCRKKQVPIPTLLDSQKILENKIALVVGGSSGIGLSIAEAFLKSGAKVIIAGRHEYKLKAAQEKLNSENVKPLIFNISDVESVTLKIEEACGLFSESRIDILVNSAGLHHSSSFETMTEEEFDAIMNINVKGSYFLCQSVGLYMRDNSIKGHILNISSSSALRPAWGPYQISKWALRGMTLGLAKKLYPFGIVVNSLAPGQTATPMLGMRDFDDISNDDVLSGRYIMPQEIANMAIFMVSEMGNMIVGDTIYMTGGSGLLSLSR